MANNVLDTSNLVLCKQKTDDIKVIFADGTQSTIHAMNVYFFSITKNFFDDFLPIFNLKCMVEYDLYKKINEQDCVFSLNINKFYVKSANTTTYDKKNIMTKNFINDTFINTNKGDSTPNMYQSIANRDNKTDLEKPNAFQKAQIELDLYLFQKQSLEYTKLNDNIFADCDVFGAILGLATVTKQRKLLMTYPNNLSTYRNIIIPNDLTFIGGIEFLQAVYGIYNKGYILFNDFNCLYLLDKDVTCNAYERNEMTRVYITYSDKTSATGNINGQFEDLSYKCYRINGVNAPTITKPSATSANILGNNVSTVNTRVSGNGSVKEDVKILDNKYDNNYAVNSYKYEKSMLSTISVDFKQIDLNILKPNKEYYFTFDMKDDAGANNYKNCEGLYKLMFLQAVYEKKDDEVFENTVKAQFIRV